MDRRPSLDMAFQFIREKKGVKYSSLLTRPHYFKKPFRVWFRLIRVVVVQVLTWSLFQSTKLYTSIGWHAEDY